MADKIRKQFNLEPEVVVGDPGEWRVLVDGQEVARKGWLTFPSDGKVLQAVEAALGRGA